MNEPGKTLGQLLGERVAAKAAEDAAAEKRKAIDSAIAAALRNTEKPEGSISQEADGYKVTVTYGLTRSADTEELQKAWPSLPEAAHLAFGWKASVNVSALRQLSGTTAAAVAKFITTKPSSPSVKVEALA